jgi:hypothetical protein
MSYYSGTLKLVKKEPYIDEDGRKMERVTYKGVLKQPDLGWWDYTGDMRNEDVG